MNIGIRYSRPVDKDQRNNNKSTNKPTKTDRTNKTKKRKRERIEMNLFLFRRLSLSPIDVRRPQRPGQDGVSRIERLKSHFTFMSRGTSF